MPLGTKAWRMEETQDALDTSALKQFDRIKTWWRCVETAGVAWPHMRSWRSELVGEYGNRGHCIAVLEILRQIIPLALDSSCLAAADLPFEVNLDAGYAQKNPPFEEQTTEYCKRHAVYLRLRRRIKQLLHAKLGKTFGETVRVLEVNRDFNVLYPSMQVNPLVYGYYLWRYSFEDDYSYFEELLHEEKLLRVPIANWPFDRSSTISVDVRAWTVFAVKSYYASVKIAENICERFASCCAPYNEDNRTYSALIHYCQREIFNRDLAWLPTITHMTLAKESDVDGDSLVIVGPLRPKDFDLFEILG